MHAIGNYIIKKIIGVSVLVLSIPLGLLFMCYAGIVTSIICLIINTYYTGKLIRVGFLMQMKDLMGTLLLSFAVFGVAYMVSSIADANIIQLLLGVSTSTVLFVSIVCLLEFKELYYVKSILNR